MARALLACLSMTTMMLSAILAQPMDGMCPGCPGMGGGMGGLMMIGSAILFVALLAALIALTVFLVRRSKPPTPR